MNTQMKKHLSLVAMLTVSAFALTGCYAEVGESDSMDEDIAEAEQGIGTECAAATPVQTFSGGFNYTSPTTYNTANCYKAVPLKVTNYETAMPPPSAQGYELYTTVGWADAEITDPAACSASWARADVFKYVNGIPVYLGFRESHGGWGDLFDVCFHPHIDISDMLSPGNTYMVAATARTAATSAAPTRKVGVKSLWVAVPE